MKINVQGGTNAGHRPPYSDGHNIERCQCSKCDAKRFAKAFVAGYGTAIRELGDE